MERLRKKHRLLRKKEDVENHKAEWDTEGGERGINVLH